MNHWVSYLGVACALFGMWAQWDAGKKYKKAIQQSREAADTYRKTRLLLQAAVTEEERPTDGDS
jgi:hypothetical protein